MATRIFSKSQPQRYIYIYIYIYVSLLLQRTFFTERLCILKQLQPRTDFRLANHRCLVWPLEFQKRSLRMWHHTKVSSIGGNQAGNSMGRSIWIEWVVFRDRIVVIDIAKRSQAIVQDSIEKLGGYKSYAQSIDIYISISICATLSNARDE